MHDVSISTKYTRRLRICIFPIQFGWNVDYFARGLLLSIAEPTATVCNANSLISFRSILAIMLLAVHDWHANKYPCRIHGRRLTNRSLRPNISIKDVNRLRLASQTHRYLRSILHQDRICNIANMSKYRPMSLYSTSLTRTVRCSRSIRLRPFNWPICISQRPSPSATKTALQAKPAMRHVVLFRLPSTHSKTSPPDQRSSS